MTRLFRSLFLFALLVPPAAAAESSDTVNARQYVDCIRRARATPEDGWETAMAWQGLGGGEAARHCSAVALIGLKKYEEAGTRLEALARDSRREPRLRAGMLAQAAQAWLLARQPERANAAQSTALQLLPDDVDLLIDRAVILAEAKNYGQAVEDLDRALALAPRRADALAFRASAYRYLDKLDSAARDIAAALAIEAENPEALLERGMLRRLKGDDKGARADWRKVTAVAPDTPAADAARQNLETLALGER